MKKILVVFMTACLVLMTGCEKDKPVVVKAVPDIEQMQGTWKGIELGGGDGEWVLVIAGEKITVDGPGPEDYVGTLALDETTTPKSVVLTIDECGFEQYVGAKANNLYTIEDGKLTIAGTEPGSGMIPSSFEPGNGTRVFELTKADIQ